MILSASRGRIGAFENQVIFEALEPRSVEDESTFDRAVWRRDCAIQFPTRVSPRTLAPGSQPIALLLVAEAS